MRCIGRRDATGQLQKQQATLQFGPTEAEAMLVLCSEPLNLETGTHLL